jgi:uncharacterized protein YqhQ
MKGLAVLDYADRNEGLPRLGGMARPDGVVIVSERFWAFAGRDGTVREGKMPKPPRTLRRIPLLRGLVRLSASLAPLFRPTGVARRRERFGLLAALAAPFALAFTPHRVSLLLSIGLLVALMAWLMRGRTLSLHGAEHRAIRAAELRQLRATWNGTARPSRFSARCGTNFAALVLPITALAERLWPLPSALYSPLAVTVVSLALTMELWELVQSSSRSLVKGLLLPGLGLQRLTTREPSLEETRTALTALASVLRRELV